MFWNYIKQKMMDNPGRIIKENDAAMSFEEALIFAEIYSKKLTESCYAILCKSEMSAALALLSCFAAGATAVPLSFRYGTAHFRRILETVKPPAIITDAGGELSIIETGEQFNLDLSVMPGEEPYTYNSEDYGEERPVLLMCTSGTTGIPKGAMISGRNLLTNIKDIEKYFDINNKDRILIARPLYHCAVMTGEFLISLVKGLDIVFSSGNFDPVSIINLLNKNEITVMCGTPTLFQMISKLKKLHGGLSKLKTIAVSGECLSKESAAVIRAALPDTRIYNVYGLTEASPRVAWLPPEYYDEYGDYVGLPLSSLQVKVVDDQENELPPNTEGELCVKGASVMEGYCNNPEMTGRALRGGWLHTGDIASINEKGFIKIHCRKDDMIIKAGINIYPQEIERALKQDERVEEAVAYGISDPMCGQKIGLKVKGTFNDISEVIKLCHEKLPAYENPSAVELVKEIPKNASGKVIRRK